MKTNEEIKLIAKSTIETEAQSMLKLVDFVDEDGAFEGDVDLVFVGCWVGVSDSKRG